MNDCTKTVTPADAGSLQSIVAALPEGAVLCLSAGVYQPVQLMVERSLTVRGIGDVVLDGRFRASTVQVNKPVDLVLESLTLKNGSGGGTSSATLRIDSRETDLASLGAMPVATSTELRNVANIRLGGKEPDEMLRLNGRPAAGLLIYKQSSVSTMV